MRTAPLLSPRRELPRVLNRDRAAQGLALWSERSAQLDDETLRDRALDLAEEAKGRALLEALFANSPFLTRCALAEIPFLLELVAGGPGPTFGGLLDDLRDRLAHEPERARLMSGLRIAKRRVALLVALADITGLWPLERLTEALTGFADTTISVALCHLLSGSAERGLLQLTDPEAPEVDCGLTVLAMGKHGAGELNYSSDIDLIVLFDPKRIDYRGERGLQPDIVRLTRDLVAILDQRTPEGYVFRTDLRLRPDPGSTPIAMPVAAALTYYQTRAQTWERAAMIKARPAAGDPDLGTHLLEQLSPFVWRDSLDFWSLRDMQAMKQQINEHKGGSAITAAGHNVKLGKGGIREIEFFAQSQQLVHGGRDEYVRCIKTVDALTTLAEAGHVEEIVAEELIDSYAFLREVEHRLQMVEDQQTQTLPTNEDGLADIAAFMAFEETGAFTDCLLGHLKRVHGYYMGLFDELPTGAAQATLKLDAESPDEATSKTLTSLGFADAKAVFACLQDWRSDPPAALEVERARRELTRLTPGLIEACGRTVDPDDSLAAFDRFLRALPEGVQPLSMLGASPPLVALLTEILSEAPALADALARHPWRLEAALAPGFHGPLPDRRLLRADLRETLSKVASIEDAIPAARRWTHEHRLQIAVALLRQRVDGAQAGQVLSDLADAVVRCLTEWVERDLLANGAPGERPAFAIVALGEAARRDLTINSPSRFRFVFTDEGSRSREIVVECANRVIEAITADGAEGRLFAPDADAEGPPAMSLRDFRGQLEAAPAGRGPSSCRVVAAPDALASEIDGVLRACISVGGKVPDQATPAGTESGLFDLAAIEQALLRLAGSGSVSGEQVKACAEAAYVLHQVRALLCLGHAEASDSLPSGTEALLLRACGAADRRELDATLAGALDLAASIARP